MEVMLILLLLLPPPPSSRYAIVVAADIAIFADGPAKPTGGCGAVALLLGADAPLPIDSSLRATHASNTWDFFKPKFASEYPEVRGDDGSSSSSSSSSSSKGSIACRGGNDGSFIY